jgi:hypothetical protein
LTEEQVLQLLRSGILSDAQGAMLAGLVRDLAAEHAKGQHDATPSEDNGGVQEQGGKMPSGEGGEQ